MTNSNQAKSRITALILVVALLFSVAAIPVFAEASDGEPPGATQETSAHGDLEPGGGESTETGEPTEPAEGEDEDNAPPTQDPDQPEDRETGPADEAEERGPANRTPTDAPVALGYSSIVAFAPLDAGVAEQEVMTGTAPEDLTLPDVLSATVEDEDGQQEQAEVPVARWNAAPDYEPLEIGTYIFTPELAAGYALADGVSLPDITVRVITGRVAAAAEGVVINEINFPDENFRNWIKSEFNKNDNDSLSAEEIAAIEIINANFKGISDLTGIEHFTSLTILNCTGNNLTELPDLPNSLTSLNCSRNWLTALPALPVGLTSLNCNGNQLTALPALPTGLTRLECPNNKLTNLDLSSLSALNQLYCNDNPLQHLVFPGGSEVNVAIVGNGTVTLNTVNDIFISNTLSYTATANAGVGFSGWQSDDISITDAANPTISVPKPTGGNKVTVTANFGAAIYNADDIAAVNAIIDAHPEMEPAIPKWESDDTPPSEWGNSSASSSMITWSGDAENKRVVSLRLNNKELTGSLDVSRLTSLTYLNCINNLLEELSDLPDD